MHDSKPAQQGGKVIFWMLARGWMSATAAQDIVTLDSVPAELESITSDESLADQFSAKRAAI